MHKKCTKERTIFVYISPQEQEELLSQMEGMFEKMPENNKEYCIGVVLKNSKVFSKVS